MSKGRRYDEDPKLNIKKVIAVIVAIAVLIMIMFMVKGIFTEEKTSGKIIGKSYFSSYKDGKWGVIDSNGNTIIEPTYSEMIIIPNSKMSVFICTYDVNYDTGEYKTKVLNEKNELIMTDYEKVEVLSNVDENNNLIYSDNVIKVQNGGKCGLINLNGKIIVPLDYDNITKINGVENSYKIQLNDKYGIVDDNGKIVIEPEYTDIDVLGTDNKSGFIVKNDDGKYGIVSYSNKPIIEMSYDGIIKVFGADLYVVEANGKQKLINKKGEDVLTEGFDTINQILASTENAVIYTSANKYGVMSTSGEVLIEASYDYIKESDTGIFIAKKGDNYGIINIKNEEKIPFEYQLIEYNYKANIYVATKTDSISNILNGSLENKISGTFIEINDTKGFIKLKTQDGYKYYNFKFDEKKESDIYTSRTIFLSKKNGKYGYIDAKGNIVVDYIYDDATEENEYGYAGVKMNGKWGSINSNGSIVVEPKYNLDNYKYIDFIGNWHHGLDLNMNYYNEL